MPEESLPAPDASTTGQRTAGEYERRRVIGSSMKDKRITRLVKLLQMLQGGRGQNWDGLAKACGVGRRTIFRDLETLRRGGCAARV